MQPAQEGESYSVIYLAGGQARVEGDLPGASAALGFAAPASYNQRTAVAVLRGGFLVASYLDGDLRTRDAEVLAAAREAEEGDEYTASVNGRPTVNGGLHGGRARCSCGGGGRGA